jgi:hypothetical protein
MEAVSKHKTAKEYMQFITDSVKDGSMNLQVAERGITAGILNNMAQICDSAKGQEFIKSGNYAPFIPEIWPIVVAWYPEFPLKDLISVQDMDKPLAWVYYSKLKVGRTKGNQLMGDVVETPIGTRKIRGSYPTGEVVGEEIPAEQIEFDTDHISTLTAYNPIVINNAESVAALDKIRVELFKSNASQLVLRAASATGNTIILGTVDAEGAVTPLAGATIDIESGLVTIPATTADDYDKVLINYIWDIEEATNHNIPKVVEDVEQHSLEAQPRALSMEWTIFSEYVKRSQFGTDIRTDTTKRVLNLLYQYQTRYILDDMYYNATSTEVHAVVSDSSSAHDLKVSDRNVAAQFKKVASLIEKISGRQEGNRIVTGADFKNYLETLPADMFKPAAEDKAWLGPREIGEYRTWKVYYDPELADNEWWMTYRGTEWYDAAYYLGEFMPVVPTDMTTFGVRVTTAFCSMEAYWYHKKNCVLKGTFTEEAGSK